MRDPKALLAKGSRNSNAIIIFTSVANYLIFTPLVVLSSLILFITVQISSPQQGPWMRLELAIIVTMMAAVIFPVPVRLASTVEHRLLHHYPTFLFSSEQVWSQRCLPHYRSIWESKDGDRCLWD